MGFGDTYLMDSDFPLDCTTTQPFNKWDQNNSKFLTFTTLADIASLSIMLPHYCQPWV